MQDLGVDRRIRIRTDAAAAKSIASRRGLGKVRHIETNQLWLQEKVTVGDIEVMKVPGGDNIADALTKPVDNSKLEQHGLLMHQLFETGRHELAPKVESGEHEWSDTEEIESEEIQEIIFRKSCSGKLQSGTCHDF